LSERESEGPTESSVGLLKQAQQRARRVRGVPTRMKDKRASEKSLTCRRSEGRDRAEHHSALHAKSAERPAYQSEASVEALVVRGGVVCVPGR
jgi:hypothetical protein